MSDLRFGIHLGIGTCGWAVYGPPTSDRKGSEIVALGTWMFDVPEQGREREPAHRIRRKHRLARRTNRRHVKRLNEVRAAFLEHGLLTSTATASPVLAPVDPWEARAKGLDEELSPGEFAAALLHIAKRRGLMTRQTFKHRELNDEALPAIRAMHALQQVAQRYRTLGEMFFKDPAFRDRKRNRDGRLDATQSRADLLEEVSTLFDCQRKLGNNLATPALEIAYTETAFHQRPQGGGKSPSTGCPFIHGAHRTARNAPSFERLRCLTRLTRLRVSSPGGERPLSSEEIELAMADLGATAKLTLRSIRQRIALPEEASFVGIRPEDETHDIVARTGEAMHGTRALRRALGESLWSVLSSQPEQLDSIAEVLAFHDEAEEVSSRLDELNLPDGAAEAVLAQLPSFARFGGSGHLSSAAARKLIPLLRMGLEYREACRRCGWDDQLLGWRNRSEGADRQTFNDLISRLGKQFIDPVTRKCVTEALKQLWAMRSRWGLPRSVQVAMTPEIGAPPGRREEIIRARTKHRFSQQRLQKELCGLLGVDEVSSEALLRFRLWTEQGQLCPYTNRSIPFSSIHASPGAYLVAHILPWSRFGDDSYSNLVLTSKDVCQEKRDRTPAEWYAASQRTQEWNDFSARIEASDTLSGVKKRNLLLRSNHASEQRMRASKLNDKRFAADLLTEAINRLYPASANADLPEHEAAWVLPLSIVNALGRAWGVRQRQEGKGEHGRDARDHALDALVAAALGKKEMEDIQSAFLIRERQGRQPALRQAKPPWADEAQFRKALDAAHSSILVARPERRRARGEGHSATIRQVRMRNGACEVFERRSLEDLTSEQLDLIKDPERNQAMIDSIREWIDQGRPADRRPRSPAGDEIRKVRVRINVKPAVPVRGGTAERGKVVRIDVFAKPDRHGKDLYYLVPIYTHQVMDRSGHPLPPTGAATAGREEPDWPTVDSSYSFQFSLFPHSYVELVRRDGQVLRGYLRGFNRTFGTVTLFNPKDSRLLEDELGMSLVGIGTRRLQAIRKFNVDRFGICHLVKREKRTWHGKVLLTPDPA